MADYLLYTTLIGTGATAFMDIAALLRKLGGTPAPDYGLVGRWLARMAHGHFRLDPIAATPPIRGERTIGWIAHYLTGIAFAALLLGAWGIDWARNPAIAPALIVGIGSLAAPFLLMQPGMGAGIAARRTPRPGVARVRSLVTHVSFGFGLYAAGWLAASLEPVAQFHQ